jgi:hypothetical protein
MVRKAIVRTAVLLLAAASGPSPRAAEQASGSKLAELLESCRQVAPVSTGAAVRERTVRVGHLELALADGRLFPVEGKDGTLFGFLFEGEGRLAYRSEDPTDRHRIQTNLERLTTSVFFRDFTIRDGIRKALLYFATPMFEELRSDPGGPPSAPLSPETRSAFDKLWEKILETGVPYDHLAAEARSRPGAPRYLFGVLEGERETWGYEFDGLRYGEERLFVFRKVSGVDRLLQEAISRQRIESEGLAGARPAELRHGDLEVATADNRTGRTASELTFQSNVEGLTLVSLDFRNHFDPDRTYWGSERNAVHVRKVTDADGRDLSYSHRYHEILVELPQPVRAGESFKLRFETEGPFLVGLDGTRADQYFALVAGSWFPQPKGWPHAQLTFRLRVRTRKPFLPIASGDTVSFKDTGDGYELEASSETRVWNPWILAGKYKTVEEKVGSVLIRAYFYAMARKDVMEKMPRVAGQFLDMFQGMLGPYPYKELDIVEVPEYGFGIAPPGMVLLTTEAYKPRLDALAAILSRGVNSRLAHEIAHQWFAHRAVPAASEDWWLAESVAEYLSGIAMGVAKPGLHRILGFKEMLAEWFAQSKLVKQAASIDGAVFLGGDEGEEDRIRLLYSRGPYVLHMLRVLVGNDRFFRILRAFLDRANGGPATTRDLEQAAARVLGTDVGWFFEQWIRQPGIPEIRVERQIERTPEGRAVLSGRIVQAEGPGFKKIHVPLVIEYAGGTQEAKIVFQDRPVTEFRYELPETPKDVRVDPSQNNLAIYR